MCLQGGTMKYWDACYDCNERPMLTRNWKSHYKVHTIISKYICLYFWQEGGGEKSKTSMMQKYFVNSSFTVLGRNVEQNDLF